MEISLVLQCPSIEVCRYCQIKVACNIVQLFVGARYYLKKKNLPESLRRKFLGNLTGMPICYRHKDIEVIIGQLTGMPRGFWVGTQYLMRLNWL